MLGLESALISKPHQFSSSIRDLISHFRVKAEQVSAITNGHHWSQRLRACVSNLGNAAHCFLGVGTQSIFGMRDKVKMDVDAYSHTSS